MQMQGNGLIHMCIRVTVRYCRYLEYLWFVLRCTALEEGKDIIGSFPSKDFFPRRNQTLGGSLDLLDHHPESLVDMHKYEEGVGTHTSLGPTCL